jgi:hypothetical protein
MSDARVMNQAVRHVYSEYCVCTDQYPEAHCFL